MAEKKIQTLDRMAEILDCFSLENRHWVFGRLPEKPIYRQARLVALWHI